MLSEIFLVKVLNFIELGVDTSAVNNNGIQRRCFYIFWLAYSQVIHWEEFSVRAWIKQLRVPFLLLCVGWIANAMVEDLIKLLECLCVFEYSWKAVEFQGYEMVGCVAS